MKALPFFLFIFVVLQSHVSGQSFREGMEHYEAEEYSEAAEIFSRSGDDRSQLFAGKSFLALMDYSTSVLHLREASESTDADIREEARYSLALAHFGLENYDLSLQYLYDLSGSRSQTGLGSDARRFYNQILNYLSIEERYRTLYHLTSPAIQYDLVDSSRPFLDSDSYRIMVEELIKLTGDTFSRQEIEFDLLSGSGSRVRQDSYPDAPDGMVYNIGVILPTFSENDPDFTIPRNLYYGMMMAAEDFNSRNPDQKVNLMFRNSAENPDTTAKAFSELAWTKKVDGVIGPLFSEPATRMARLAEEMQIPMLAPLANSDSLNLDYNYTFQLNPTFEIHGKRMAQFAVDELNLDRIAIITEEGSLGRTSALAFRHEAERLGAQITYFLEEDFASSGYDFSELTRIFTRDQELVDSLNITPSQAVYAPFTGEASTTMINLLMNNLEAMRSNIVILGSEQWEYASLTDYQQRFFDIWYSQPYGEPADTSMADFFRQDYNTRFGSEPDRFSRIGYDAANFLFQSLKTAGNPDYLGRALRNRPLHNGLAFRVHFDGKRVNQEVFIKPLTEAARALNR